MLFVLDMNLLSPPLLTNLLLPSIPFVSLFFLSLYSTAYTEHMPHRARNGAAFCLSESAQAEVEQNGIFFSCFLPL